MKTPAFFSGGGEMGALMRAFDWSATPLGAAPAWPQPLQTLVGVMLAAKQPMFLAWGAQHTLLYNDAYAPILGRKHPCALGRPFHDVWPEIRADLDPLFEQVFAGEPVHMDDITLFLERRGRPEEAHFAFSYTPVRDPTGAVAGLFCPCSETTQQVFAERRRAFRLSLEESLRGVEDPEAIIEAAVQALGRHLGANRVGYGRVRPDGETIVLATSYADGVRPLDGAFSLARFGADLIARQRRGLTVAQDDVLTDPSLDPAVWAEIETRAFVSVPLVRDGALKATLFVHRREPRAWSAEEVALIEEVAKRVWDAVERARAEAALRESQERLRAALLASGTGTFRWDLRGDMFEMDEGFERLLGLPPGQGAGRGIEGAVAAFVHPEDRGKVAAEVARILAEGGGVQIEYRVVRADDGAVRWLCARGEATRGPDGKPLQMIGAVVDVTERRRFEEDLVAAKEAAEGANRAKSQFLANMSHELRTPLSAIIGYTEMLQEEAEDGAEADELLPDLRKIEANARHLLGLINDVLDLSKVESGKMEVFAEDFDAEAVVREVAATVQGLVEKKGNALRLDVAPGVGTMHSDVVKIRQMLLNLLSNAAKFTEGGTITLSAERVRRDGQDWVRLAVSDTGLGMTEEQLSKLFQRFQQADASTTRKFGGTGLGLALTKAFSAMLGGDVAVRSAPGQGTTFTVTLPATYHEPRPLGQDATVTGEVVGNCVLVVDDDPAARELLTRFLEREGFAVRTAADGRGGLELARALRPRAILLDVMMPGMDGWAVLGALKADPELAAIPVVMETFVGERGLAGSLGAADFLAKPVEWDQLKRVMDRFLPQDPSGHVLVVEDDAGTRERLRAVLEREGWPIAEASDGHEALDMVARGMPSLVLLDLTMPGMDGFAFLDALRTLPAGQDVPVVVLTAKDVTAAERERLPGVERVLLKGETGLRDLVERLRALVPPARPDAA